MERDNLLAIVYAINEIVELDEWTLEEMSYLIKMEPDHIVELLNEASDLYKEEHETTYEADVDDEIY